MKLKTKKTLFYIIITTISLVGLFLFISTSEIIQYRIAILFIALSLLIPIFIISFLIKDKKIDNKWFIAVLVLMLIFVGIILKTFTLSKDEFKDIIKRIEPIDVLSS